MTALGAALGIVAVAFGALAVSSRHPRRAGGALAAGALAGAALLVVLGASAAGWAQALVLGTLVPLVTATGERTGRARSYPRVWTAATIGVALAATIVVTMLGGASPEEVSAAPATAATARPLLPFVLAGVCLPLAVLVSRGQGRRRQGRRQEDER